MELVKERWEEIKEKLRIEHELSDVSYKTWIKPLEVDHVDHNTVTILVTLDGALSYVKNKYALPLRVIIAEVTGTEYDVEFISPSQQQPVPSADHASTSKLEIAAERAGVNYAYSFDSFVVGKNNELAHAAALAVAESPGTLDTYNPLFLYGGVGLGKTHLMHAIANYVLEHSPEKSVLYVTSEDFTNEVIKAIRSGKSTVDELGRFRNQYRNVDVLLIDDIQFIVGKESTQEEFFNTFNTLYLNKKQIVISSDRAPDYLEKLDERYRSRFKQGLMADIGAPDYETRMAILRKKESEDKLNGVIPDDVLSYIATNVKSNIRELEGCLTKLNAYSRLKNETITVALAEQALKDMIMPQEERKVTPELIMDIVADHFQITVEDIKGNKRSNSIVLPRQVFMYLCRSLTDTTYEKIGEILGGKDHSTVAYGEKIISKNIKEDEKLKNTIDIIRKKINPS